MIGSIPTRLSEAAMREMDYAQAAALVGERRANALLTLCREALQQQYSCVWLIAVNGVLLATTPGLQWQVVRDG